MPHRKDNNETKIKLSQKRFEEVSKIIYDTIKDKSKVNEKINEIRNNSVMTNK